MKNSKTYGCADTKFTPFGTIQYRLASASDPLNRPYYYLTLPKDGMELNELLHTQVQLGNPVLVGLAVCSHKADASDTVVFSDVSVEQAGRAVR
jgi:hypothetical protein